MQAFFIDMEKYSKDGVVLFKESNHTYTNVKTGKKLVSVTTKKKEWENPFDSIKHATKRAELLDLTVDEVLDMWGGKGDNSNELGTYCHTMPENYLLGKPYLPNRKYPKSYIMLSWIRQYFESGHLTPIESEFIVYNDFIAGQIDNISKAGDLIHIFDFKTNEELDDNNYRKFMLGDLRPFKIPDSKFHRYCLQLSIYKVMYERQTGNKVSKLFIVYIGEKEHKTITAIDYSEQLKMLDIFK